MKMTVHGSETDNVQLRPCAAPLSGPGWRDGYAAEVITELDLAAAVVTSVVPAARQQKGNRGAWLVLDRATGKGVAISLWDSMADLEAGEANGYYQQQVSQFGSLMTAPPVREAYEVAVQG